MLLYCKLEFETHNSHHLVTFGCRGENVTRQGAARNSMLNPEILDETVNGALCRRIPDNPSPRGALVEE